MISITWEYIVDRLNLKALYTPKSFVEDLNCLGLETKLLTKGKDNILEFDVFPNRPDLLSWIGIIKEVSTLMDLDFVEKKKNHLSLENRRIFLDIENKSEKVISANYMLIENVTVGESSNWLKKILFFNNIKPVNNFVDISNLVMLKAGQPLHIFDYDLIKNKKITLRSGKENEAFKDLKGRKINLTENDLVAALKEEVIDLLGVIGDQSTSLTEKSKNILVECAFLESKNVETTSKRTQTRTRASEYFSKGANVFLPPEEVFKEFLAICSREIEENINYKVQLDAKWKKPKEEEIEITKGFVEKRFGIEIADVEFDFTIKRLRFDFRKEKKKWIFKIPSHRKDIYDENDLLEEIAKIYDLNRLPGRLFSEGSEQNSIKRNPFTDLKRNLTFFLSIKGWREILTYSLIPESEEKIQEDEEYYSLIKPKSEKHYKYRQSLINSHLEVINYNLSRKNCNLFFFEISSVYKKKAEKLFHEDILILSGCGKKIEQKFHKEIIDFDFFWMKGIVEELLAFLRIPDNSYYFEKCENTKIGIFINGKKIGSIVRKTDKIFFSELILTEIDNFRKNEKEKYREISSFPYSEKDITIEVNGDVNYKKMIELINEKSNQELLRRTELLDVYVDSRMKKEGKKSVSLRMIFQRNDRTIKREEIEREIKTILFFLKKDFSAKLR